MQSVVNSAARFAILAVLVAMPVASWAQTGTAPPAPGAEATPAPAAPATPAPTTGTPAAPAAPAAGTPAGTSNGNDAAAEAAATSRSGDAQYEMRLREIEERVVGIKERIFQTKTRLLLLKEQILDNVIAESRAILRHKNEMGSFFELEQVTYFLDSKRIYFQDNTNGLLEQRPEFEIYNGSIIPGNHTLNAELQYRGSSNVFTYLKGYVFKLKSSYTFYAAKGRITEVAIIGYERGGVGTDLEDKPYIRYEVKQLQNRAKTKPVAAPTKK
jgi:hypothetical protein